MIKLLRVDDRLLHGQVSFFWTEYLSLKTIVVVNDEASEDDFTRMTLEFAKPKDVKLVIIGIADCKELLAEEMKSMDNSIVIVSSLFDAQLVSDIMKQRLDINLGGLRNRPNSLQVTDYLYLTNEDVNILKNFLRDGLSIEVRKAPMDPKINLKEYFRRNI